MGENKHAESRVCTFVTATFWTAMGGAPSLVHTKINLAEITLDELFGMWPACGLSGGVS